MAKSKSEVIIRLLMQFTNLISYKVCSMDPAVLTAFLTPFLPFLKNLGQKAAESAAGKFGEEAWNKAKAIWAKLLPEVEAKEAAKEAVDDVAKDPDNEDLQVALRVQIKKLLEGNPALGEEMAQILKEDAPNGTPGMQIVQAVTGNQNQVIGQMTGGKAIKNVTGNVNM